MVQRTAVIPARPTLPPTAARPDCHPAPTRRPANLARKLTLKLSHPPELTRLVHPATLHAHTQIHMSIPAEGDELTLAPRRPDNTHVKATTHFAYRDATLSAGDYGGTETCVR